MKIYQIACGLVAAAMAPLTGCAGNSNSIDRTFAQAESSRALALDMKLEESATASANAKLDSAKVLKEQGKNEQAEALAEQSNLEYRLAMATAERNAIKKEDEKVEKELRSDVERKLLYQGILDKEQNKETNPAGGNK